MDISIILEGVIKITQEELRTLYNGKTKTITTNLETIESEVN